MTSMGRHAMDWHVTVRVFRYKQDGAPPRFDRFVVEVKPDEYVIDAIERVWAEQDRSLVFRHACHHGACGACGMRINGREKLPCITAIRSITIDGGTLSLEPLRNLPVISDLLVDMAPFYERMERVHFTAIRIAEPVIEETSGRPAPQLAPVWRFENCLECGLCFSACPISGTDPGYLGPAALAALARMIDEPRGGVDVDSLRQLADSEHGCWRCHTAFECSEVCPTGVDPARSIGALRRQAANDGLGRMFRPWR
jgi:succinate dehydrogenase / fumarate reductase iron-sulfur subunit